MNTTVRVARLKHGYDRPIIDGDFFPVDVEIGRSFRLYELLVQTKLEFKDSRSGEVVFDLPLNHYIDTPLVDWYSYLQYSMWMGSLHRNEPANTLPLKEFGLPPKSDEEKRKATGRITYKGMLGKRRYYVVSMMDEKTSFLFSIEREDFKEATYETQIHFLFSDESLTDRPKAVYYTSDRLVLTYPKNTMYGEEITYVGEFVEPLHEYNCANRVLSKTKSVAPILALKREEAYGEENLDHRLLLKSKGYFTYVESGDGKIRFVTNAASVDRLNKVASYIAIGAAASGDSETVREYAMLMEMMDGCKPKARLPLLWKFVRDREYLGIPVSVDPLAMDDGTLRKDIDAFHAREIAYREERSALTNAYYKMRRGSAPGQYTTEELIALQKAGFDLTTDPFRFGEDQLSMIKMDTNLSSEDDSTNQA